MGGSSLEWSGINALFVTTGEFVLRPTTELRIDDENISEWYVVTRDRLIIFRHFWSRIRKHPDKRKARPIGYIAQLVIFELHDRPPYLSC